MTTACNRFDLAIFNMYFLNLVVSLIRDKKIALVINRKTMGSIEPRALPQSKSTSAEPVLPGVLESS